MLRLEQATFTLIEQNWIPRKLKSTSRQLEPMFFGNLNSQQSNYKIKHMVATTKLKPTAKKKIMFGNVSRQYCRKLYVQQLWEWAVRCNNNLIQKGIFKEVIN